MLLSRLLGSAYLFVGQPDRYVELCRAQVARSGDGNTFARANLVFALAVTGSTDEAMLAADGLIEAVEATGNPWVLAYTLFAWGYTFRGADSGGALEALRRGVRIAEDSGNRFFETQFSYWLCGLEAEQGDPVAALDYLAMAIRHNHESGNIGVLHNPWLSWPRFSTGSDATNQRPPSPVSQRSIHSHRDHARTRHSNSPPPRGPRRPDLRIARLRGKDDDRRRHRVVRL